MKTIITIQHTQSVQHTNGIIGSWTDWELTDLGKGHAENIGRKLSAELMICVDKPGFSSVSHTYGLFHIRIFCITEIPALRRWAICG